MPIIETSTGAVLQKLIDDAVHEVCAEYKKHASIKTRVVALMNDSERKIVGLKGDGRLRNLSRKLDEADSAIEALGTDTGIAIIYFLQERLSLVLIRTRRCDCTAHCAFLLDRNRSDGQIG